MTDDNDNLPDALSSTNRPTIDATDERLRTRDECAAIALKDRVMNSDGLKLLAPDGHWEVAISRALDLFEEPRNINELWVWARFCWAFGRRDTWAANGKFEEMLQLIALISDNAVKWVRRDPEAGAADLERNARELGDRLRNILTDIYQNDFAWNDRADFMAFKGRET
jgi:hypothetical protein